MFDEFRNRTLDDFEWGAGIPSDIIDNTFESPGAIEMLREKPVTAPNETELMGCLQIEKQPPAFFSNLDVRGEVRGHRLIYPANAVDTQFLDHDFLNNARFLRSLILIGCVYGIFIFHFLSVTVINRIQGGSNTHILPHPGYSIQD